MPHLMNCSHSEEGWCLDCVATITDRYEPICTAFGLHPETELDELLATIQAVRSEARNYPNLQLKVAGLREQVKMLRKAMEDEVVGMAKRSKCSEHLESFGPCCSHHDCHAISRMRKVLIATETAP